MITIKQVTESDVAVIRAVAESGGKSKDDTYFVKAFEEQSAGKRLFYAALNGEQPAGFVHLVWTPNYKPFARLDIPEIQDLTVARDVRQQGIGTVLMEQCEQKARDHGKTEMGLGVGLTDGYGPAQRLYVKRGYVPDGGGITYDDQPVVAGKIYKADDLLMLKMIKRL